MNIQAAPNATKEIASVDVGTVRAGLADGDEIAFVDIREEGIHGEGHPLLAVNIPYSRLEAEFPRLVPRPATRIVLLAEPDLGLRAARRLAGLGYTGVQVLRGGAEAWTAAGERLFASINVPSKAFAECVEHAYHTPDIVAEDLDRRRRAGEDVVVLDSRTREEFARFHVPGAISAPGAELVHRFTDLVQSPETLVVVSCAGRTRGIIGAQALINAGVPNRVVALSGGTQGWRLAGLELERDTPLASHIPPCAEARGVGRRRAEALALRFGVPIIDFPFLARLRADADRTTYLFDVRSPEEYAAGHAELVVSAQGGQLVQSLDKWAATRGSRIVLTDDDGVRAIVTAHWLRQLGWDASVLPGLISGDAPPSRYPALGTSPNTAILSAEAAKKRLEGGAILLSVDPSAAYRAGHLEGAIWANRSRLDGLASVRSATSIVVAARDAQTGHLAALDLAELTSAEIFLLIGNETDWRKAGLGVVATPNEPPDADRVDYLFWLHDRHGGNPAASRAYLDWELALPAAIGSPQAAGFRIGPVQNALQ
jgi:rhodanese-related sulfurtransferase